MRTIKVKRKKVDLKQYIRRSTLTDDYSELITEPCVIKDQDEKIIAVYGILNIDIEYLRQAILRIKMSKNRRTKGLRTQSKIFGYMPREKIRKDWCSSVSLSRDQPKEHGIVCNFAKTLSKYYETYSPEVFAEHLKTVNEVLPEWKIEESPFTSGIINKNNQLNYHHDRGNFKDVYSNQICFRKDTTGGHLSIPEYDIGLEICDKSVLFFDGRKILHGVTKIEYQTPEAYRFTLVYYSLKQMWQCLPIDEELNRIKKQKAKLEEERYKRMTGTLENDQWKDKMKEI